MEIFGVFYMVYKIIIFLLLLGAFFVPAVSAEPIWTVPITCQSGDDGATLAFGTNSDATVGYDPGIDVIAPDSSGGTDFYFLLLHSDYNRLREDYRPAIDAYRPEDSWTLAMTADEPEDPVSLSWNTAAVPADIPELLLAAGGTSTDMRSVSQILLPAGTTSATITARYGVTPEAAFSADTTGGAAPLEVHFLDESAGDPSRWSWDFGDGETSAEQNPVHTYTRPGRYTVTLTVENDAGLSTETKPEYIVVAESLVAGFIADVTAGTAPLEVAFTDLSTGNPTAWEWDFGDGSTSAKQHPKHKYTEPGSYAVSLTVRNAAASATKTVPGYISVVTPLTADFDANPRSGTAPLDVRFTDLSAGTPSSWEWDLGDGSGSDLQNPVHTYTDPGAYTVTLVIRDAYGSATEVKSGFITVSAALDAEFEADLTQGTAPFAVTFTDRSAGEPTSWLWDFGDMATSTEQHPVHTYLSDGIYTVRLTVATGSGSDTETKVNYIAVGSPPSASFSASPTDGPAPLAVSFTDRSTGDPTTYRWDFGDGTSSTLKNPVHTYSVPGVYSVSLTVGNAFGQDTSTRPGYITVTQLPQAEFSADRRSVIPLQEVHFSDLSTGNPTSWAWDFGNGGRSDQQNPGFTYTRPGTYTVTLTVSNAYGSDTEVKTGYISVGVPPDAGFGADTRSGPAPLTVRFSDQSTGTPTSWLWTFGDGTTSTYQNPTHTYLSTGVYSVTLRVTNNFGSDELSRAGYIVVGDPPVADFDLEPSDGLAPLTVRFTDRSTGDPSGWHWDFGDGGSSTDQNPSHQYRYTGIYDVTLTVTNPYGSSAITLVEAVRVVNSLMTIPGCLYPPTDPDGDGCCEDLNGNLRKDYDDVVLYFNNIEWIQNNEPVFSFDFNHNGRIDFADIVRMFLMV
jgi:PKD repeat protein